MPDLQFPKRQIYFASSERQNVAYLKITRGKHALHNIIKWNNTAYINDSTYEVTSQEKYD